TPSALRSAVAPDATLVVTDQNRRRARIWSSVLDNVGYTEQAGEKPVAVDTSDARLPLFPGETNAAFTTTLQGGVKTIQASAYGNTISYTPEDRAARALDGDPATAWRADALGNAVGQFIRLQLDGPISTDHVNLVQPLTGPRDRFITRVDLIFDGKTTVPVTLDASSRTAAGQTISFGTRRFSTLEIKITDVTDPRRKLFGGADAVGFAEIRLRDQHADHDIQLDEVIQMPQDLLDALGAATATHPLILVMTRDAVQPVPPRTDPELSIARTFDLPGPRTFALTGNADVNPNAPNAAIDAALGLSAPSAVTADASASLAGCLACRAASAADGNPATAWNTPFAQVGGQWVQFEAPKPIRVSQMLLQVVADGRHSVPTSIKLQVDGSQREITVPPITDRSAENATVAVHLQFPAMTGRRIRVTITGAREQLVTRESTLDTVAAPVAIAELGIPGLRMPAAPAELPGTCRSDLLTIDGTAIPVRVTGAADAASQVDGLAVTPCDPHNPGRIPTISLTRGVHVIRTSQGLRTGIQLDRIVLASAADGSALPVGGGRVTRLGTASPTVPQVTMVHDGPTRMRVHVSGATEPFWLVLGESQSNGWTATIANAGGLGRSHLVDGYANGWLVQPKQAAFDVVLEWTPQRRVWTAIWLSLAAAIACVGIAVVSYLRRRTPA
ncbi:MAG TPA: discoidin domain-containing protein, partial [Acidimicrobiia bacterium]|nr:discoidin domain-containing protein [Acidimicrobiia bacterium]